MEPGRDDVAQMVGALMAVMGGIERAKRKGDAARLVALQAVAVAGRIRPSDIAAETAVHQSTVTRQIQALERVGFVRIDADPDDRRSCWVTLTDAGRTEVERLTEIGLSRFALFVADWDVDEVRTLGRLLEKLATSKAAVALREQAQSTGRSWQRRTPS